MTSRREGTGEVAAQARQQSQQVPDQPKAHLSRELVDHRRDPLPGDHQSTRPGASANSFGIASPDGCIRVVAVMSGGPRSSRATSAGGSVGPLAGVVDEVACLEQQIGHLSPGQHTLRAEAAGNDTPCSRPKSSGPPTAPTRRGGGAATHRNRPPVDPPGSESGVDPAPVQKASVWATVRGRSWPGGGVVVLVTSYRRWRLMCW